MKGLMYSALVLGVFLYSLLVEVNGADRYAKSKVTPIPSLTPEKTSASPFLVQFQPGVTSLGEIGTLVQQNSSLPFSLRFAKPERKSDKFHYPILPSVYWSLHKKPEVPLVEPDQELDFGFEL